MKKNIFLVLIILGLVLPIVSFAAAPNFNFNDPLVICGRAGKSDCTLCDIFKMAQRIIDWITAIILLASPILIGVGGGMILMAGANPKLLDSGKAIIKNVIIGIIIAFLAWVVIDMVFNQLADQGRFPWPWNKIECEGGGINETPTTPTTPPADTGQWCKRSDPSGSNVWQLSGINPKQKGDASPALTSFLNCMYGKITNLVVTSISADTLCSNPSCDTTRDSSCGPHTINSCHYGGSQCTGSSYAVDLGTNIKCSVIKTAAQQCNSNAWINWESNHTHVSINNTGCGCAESGTGIPCNQ